MIQDFKSESWNSFLSLRKRARTEAESGNAREAMRQYQECLIVSLFVIFLKDYSGLKNSPFSPEHYDLFSISFGYQNREKNAF